MGHTASKVSINFGNSPPIFGMAPLKPASYLVSLPQRIPMVTPASPWRHPLWIFKSHIRPVSALSESFPKQPAISIVGTSPSGGWGRSNTAPLAGTRHKTLYSSGTMLWQPPRARMKCKVLGHHFGGAIGEGEKDRDRSLGWSKGWESCLGPGPDPSRREWPRGLHGLFSTTLETN